MTENYRLNEEMQKSIVISKKFVRLLKGINYIPYPTPSKKMHFLTVDRRKSRRLQNIKDFCIQRERGIMKKNQY